MDRIWLKSYPAGVPADIDPKKFRSLIELFDSSIARYRDRPAFHSMGKTLSFGDIERLSRDFAAWLQLKGLQKGARVAIMMPNCLQYPVAMFGALRAGYTVVNVNPLYTPRELEHQLKDSGAEAIIILENFAANILDGTPLLAPGSDGINGVRLANAIHLSSWTGSEVGLDFDEDQFLAELNKRIAEEGKFPERS